MLLLVFSSSFTVNQGKETLLENYSIKGHYTIVTNLEIVPVFFPFLSVFL